MKHKIKAFLVGSLLAAMIPMSALAVITPPGGQAPDLARANRIEALKKLINAQIRRADNAFTRMEKIAGRIQEYQTKLEGEGIDTSSIDSLLDKADQQKQDAQTLLTDAKVKYAAISSATNPRQAVRDFMTAFNNLKKKMIEWHKTLMQVVRTLKSLEKGVSDE